MESRFLHAIDAAVERALPAGWPRVPGHRLPARGAMRIRHAFRREAGNGPASFLAIAAVPPFGTAPRALRREVLALVDVVLSRGATLLLLLYEGAGDPEGWIDGHVGYPHPRLLTLACAWQGGCCHAVGAIDHGGGPLADSIFDLWRTELCYVGPCDGWQTVGVEILRDHCWRCRAGQGTVTGLVFPDREVEDWAAPDWAYFGGLVELASVPASLMLTLSSAVDGWRAAGETALTPVRWRYSNAMRSFYWAAECPACGALQGAFPVMEGRMEALGYDLTSRLCGDLSYRPLRLDVPRRALQALELAFELSLHARPFGWYRAGGLDLLDERRSAMPSTTRAAPSPQEVQAAQTVAESGVPNLSAESPHPPTAGPAPGARASAGSFKRLGQILLPWRGLRRRP
jgi:hypothetical protein